MKEKVMEALKDYFRPEFLNRLDEIIVFDILSKEAILKIVNLKIQIVQDRLLAKNINLKISDEALNYLAQEGYNPHYGARPINRLIQTKILNPIATFIISKGVKKGETLSVSIRNKEIFIENQKGKIKSPIKIKTKIEDKI